MEEERRPALSAEAAERILRFERDRDWRQFHSPKDLAISLTLEAAELLEIFQWSGSDTGCEGRQERIAEELADVLTCCVMMADVCGVDLDAAVLQKMARNEAKYPAEKARGNKAKYTEL